MTDITRHSNKLLMLIYLAFCFLSLIPILSFGQQWQYDEPGAGATIQYRALPTIFPYQSTEYAWSVENIQGVYFNDGGVIGEDTRVESARYCRVISLDVELQDGTLKSYDMIPEVALLDPLFMTFFVLTVFHCFRIFRPVDQKSIFNSQPINLRGIGATIIRQFAILCFCLSFILPFAEFLFVNLSC